MTQNKELIPNTTLSHYRIVSKIGEGGMGEVYLAQDTKLDRKVAIKFLNQECAKDSDKLRRFIQEAKAASALNHPNILTVHEIGEVDGKNYISTELIDGQTLRQQLSQKEALPLNTILKIGVQVAEALSAAHQAGIFHRDIKPENIMIRRDGYARVLDFGLAKLSELLAVALARSGGRGEATKLRDELKSEIAGRYVPSYFVAIADTALNEKEGAFAALEKDITERSSYTSGMPIDPLLDDLRTDPRWAAVVQKVASSKID